MHSILHYRQGGLSSVFGHQFALASLSSIGYALGTPQREAHTMTCEDFPCCGHEAGDCNGGLYGSDESIKQAEWDRMAREDNDGCWDDDEDENEDGDDAGWDGMEDQWLDGSYEE